MTATHLRVKFVDFWKGFEPDNNIFVEALRKNFEVDVLGDDAGEVPQLLIYSAFGMEHIHYDCMKVYYSGENDVPDFNQCDYAISSHFLQLGDRHMRLPQYLLYKEFDMLDAVVSTSTNGVADRPFCSVVVSNSVYADPQRVAIIDAIERYKPLAYGGAFRNNVGGRVPDKMEFIKRYKFNIALENSCVDGYTTEKIVEPMAAHTIPIYWGNGKVGKEFNPEAFINAADYNDYDGVVREIERIDNDNEAYLKMLCAPKIVPTARVDWFAQLSDFFAHIVGSGRRYVQPYGILGHMQYMQRRKELLYSNTLLRKCAGAWIKLKGGK